MAIIFNPGQTVSPADWDALMRQHGGNNTPGQAVPITDPKIKELIVANPDLAAHFQQHPAYRYYMEDGSSVIAFGTGGDDVQIVDYKPSTKFTQAQKQEEKPSSTAVPADAVPRIEGTPLPGGGFDNEQPVQVWRRPDGTVVKTEPLTGPERTKWEEDRQKSRNPGGKTDAQIAAEKKEAEAKAEREAAANRGTTTLKPDGKGGTIAVTTYPDGRAPTTVPVPNVPSEAQNKYREVKQDPSTGKWSGLTASGQWEEIAGGPGLPPDKSGFAIEPAGAPPASSRYGSIVEESLVKYRDFLNQQVASGNLKPVDADKLMQTRLAQAQATMAEQQGVVNTQTGIYGQNISQRGQSLGDAQSRRTAAGNIHATVMQSFMPLLKYMPLGGGQAFLDLLTHGMEEGLKNAQKWGGLRESPEIQLGPAAAAANRATLPGQGAPVASGGSFMTPYQSAAPLPAAAAAAVAPPPEIPMTPERAAGIMASPVFRPQPMVAAPPMAAPPLGQGQDLSGPVSFLNPYQQPQPQPGSGLERLVADPDIDNAIVARAYADVYGSPMPGFGL